ncbi:glycoside hydrolase family 6 protein [Streptomyces sp. B6B3]|uniref:glycoside hydrolase family 6 protein n=1 Tax=Streptomyces sp. B6B3 TaxID=3153570 RepID=UPI00325E740A
MEPRSRARSGRTCRVLPVVGAFALAAGLLSTAGAAPAATAAPAAPADPYAEAAAVRVDNPYAGARVYVNPEWSARAAAEPGGAAVAGEPTAVWLDFIASVAGLDGAMGLRDHLDAALEQGADVVQVVLNDLPYRDCDWLMSNAEMWLDELPRYRQEFVDPIADILADPAYADLRVVAVVEPDSLARMVTHTGDRPEATEGCRQVAANGVYLEGVGYALARLGTLPNVYPYLDIGNHGQLGFDDTFDAAVEVMYRAATAAGGTVDAVHGLVTNVAGYAATHEPYFAADDVVDGEPVSEGSGWLAGNGFADEVPYALAFREAAIERGFDPGIGALVDTSRNGWGGPDRPTGPGPATTAEEYVEAGRTDRRLHQGNWCNQAGAGLGERPTAAPEPGIDAYAWVKPPGESDGASIPLPQENAGFTPLCDPTYTGNAGNGNNPTGALLAAPPTGRWFAEHFASLLANAWPPLP